jgi:hypothetical protein
VADSIVGRATYRDPEMFTDSWSAMLSTHPGDAPDQAIADATVIGRPSPSTDDAPREGQIQTRMVPIVSIFWDLHLLFRQNTWLAFAVTIMDCAAADQRALFVIAGLSMDNQIVAMIFHRAHEFVI